jgi:hypothetical protein
VPKKWEEFHVNEAGKAADGIPLIKSLVIGPRSKIRHIQEASAHEESITEYSEMFNLHDHDDGCGHSMSFTMQ